jgi:hypothetical protein
MIDIRQWWKGWRIERLRRKKLYHMRMAEVALSAGDDEAAANRRLLVNYYAERIARLTDYAEPPEHRR